MNLSNQNKTTSETNAKHNSRASDEIANSNGQFKTMQTRPTARKNTDVNGKTKLYQHERAEERARESEQRQRLQSQVVFWGCIKNTFVARLLLWRTEASFVFPPDFELQIATHILTLTL